MIRIGMMVWVKLRKKYYQHVWILWRVAHFVSITLISSPDQNFSAGIRRVLKTVLYLIVLFNDTFIFFLFYLWLDRWSTLVLIYSFEIWNAIKLYIFVFRSLKFDRAKSKWKESATDANAVSHGHPMDGFLLHW